MQPYDLIIIGSGPGGYVGAIRAAQLGMKVAVVEREYLGGTCLNVGCIPSKALLDSSERYYQATHVYARHGINLGQVTLDIPKMIARKNDVVKQLTGGVGYLFKKNKIDSLRGHGTIAAPGVVEVVAADGSKNGYEAKNICIATGSIPSTVPALKVDEKMILSSTGALNISELPKRLLVVGGGYIGVEMGSVWARLGTEVIVIEYLDGILPANDREMATALQKLLEKQGMSFRFNTAVEGAKIDGKSVTVTWKSRDAKESGSERVDKVLVAVGRKPMTDKLGLDKVGITLDPRGFIPVDAHFATSSPHIYAIGDVIGGIMLAHKAEEEGVALAENLAGKSGHVNYATCPAVVYTHPELASVGLTETQAKERGPIKVGKFQMMANGRAKAIDETEGFVKMIADAKTDRILGVHILAAHASDLIAECVTAMEFHASAEDLARTFHGHPTLSEAVREAALGVDGRVRQS